MDPSIWQFPTVTVAKVTHTSTTVRRISRTHSVRLADAIMRMAAAADLTGSGRMDTFSKAVALSTGSAAVEPRIFLRGSAQRARKFGSVARTPVPCRVARIFSA